MHFLFAFLKVGERYGNVSTTNGSGRRKRTWVFRVVRAGEEEP